MLYLTPSPYNLPPGTKYRILSQDQHHGGDYVIQSPDELELPKITDADLPALGFHGPNAWKEANEYKTVDRKGNETWEVVPPDTSDEEIQIAVDKIAELSFKYPAKVSTALKNKVDKATTEGLLSADGNQITINSPQGWKKAGR